MTFSQQLELFRPELVESSARNIEEAMRFCDSMAAGGGTNVLPAVTSVLQVPRLDAVYLVTDGKCDIRKEMVVQFQQTHLTSDAQPKLQTIGINCVPRHLAWRALEVVAELTQATFRPVCLQQALDNIPSMPARFIDDAVKGMDFTPASQGGGMTDEDAATGDDDGN